MAGKTRYFLERNGRFFARIVVPKELRPFLENKTELRKPLGPDRRQAMRHHPGAVAELMHQITLAERRAAAERGRAQMPGRYPLTDAQIAVASYNSRLVQDWDARKHGPAYAAVMVDDSYVERLRSGIAGTATDAELEELVGHRIEHYRKIGNTVAQPGTSAWRSLAMSLCISEYEALGRMAERDAGDFAGQPEHPLIRDAEPVAEELPPIPLHAILAGYLRHMQDMGRSKSTVTKWRKIFDSFRIFVGHDDARRITRQDVMQWRDTLMQTLSAKTVGTNYLAAIRAAFAWAHSEDQIPDNPTKEVRQRVPKRKSVRPKGYSDDEAKAILAFSRAYVPAEYEGAVRELPEMTAAKRWAPIICAHTGARISEITQLRKQDVRREGEHVVIRITPDAGSVKTGEFRDVPLHRQIVELGFMAFVEASKDGPLFYRSKDPGGEHAKAARQGNRLATWLQEAELVPAGIQPNHAWRHRFRTIARDVGISDAVADAICGHAGRTTGDGYGHISMTARARAIAQMPAYDLAPKRDEAG